MTRDDDIAALLGTPRGDDDRAFRMRVIAGIYARQQRIAAVRRGLVWVALFGLIGLTAGLLGQSNLGLALLEPMSISVCLCGAAAELSAWFINGRSLFGSRFRWFA